MKTILVVLSAVLLFACEWDVHEEPAPDPYVPPAHGRTPAPVPSPSPPSSSPSFTSSDAGVEDAPAKEPAYTCEGEPWACNDFDAVFCEQQRGCVLSASDATCFGSPTPCAWLSTMSTCEAQVGCVWTPPPPR